jgi:hypothetical protein
MSTYSELVENMYQKIGSSGTIPHNLKPLDMPFHTPIDIRELFPGWLQAKGYERAGDDDTTSFDSVLDISKTIAKFLPEPTHGTSVGTDYDTMAQNIKKKIKLVPGKGPKAEGDVKKLEFKQLHDAMQRAVAIIARSIAYSSTEARMSDANSSNYISKVTYPSNVHKYIYFQRVYNNIYFSL